MVQVKFITIGAHSAGGSFGPGDRLTCSEAYAKHLVEEAQCAVYVQPQQAPKPPAEAPAKPARKPPAEAPAKPARKPRVKAPASGEGAGAPVEQATDQGGSEAGTGTDADADADANANAGPDLGGDSAQA